MSEPILPTTPAETTLAATFDAAQAGLPGTAAIAAERRRAFAAFARAGLPNRRIEAWHYTDLRHLMRQALPLAGVPAPQEIATLTSAAARLPVPHLVLVDGVFAPQLSSPLPAGVSVTALASALAEGQPALIESLGAAWAQADDAIISLNAALMQDGLVIDVAPGTRLEAPLTIVYASVARAPVGRFSRSLVRIGAGAAVRLNEMSLGQGGRVGQTNNVLILEIGEGADVAHSLSLTDTTPDSLRLETFMVRLAEKAKFESFALMTGAGLVRRQIYQLFAGADAKAALRGVALLRGREHADTTLFVRHAAPGCEGRQNFRYILDDEATGVFQGKIVVERIAQKTDGRMLTKALVLSDDATMNSRPELEIFADDVACGHGATVGGLNAEQLFYLETRGLPAKQAEALLLEAFAAELVDEIGEADLVAAYRADVAAWLTGRAKA
jgi:Fe-S cluster assembly protein SufD